MSRGERPRRRAAGGFTYIGLLIAVAILGLMLSAAGTVWSIAAKREKEAELLFIGHQFRDAIGHYRAAGGVYPRELADLVTDDRSPVPRHFLRRIYRDPMTGADDWQVIRAADGGVMGVASNSQANSLKRSNFDVADAGFEGFERYCDWQFISFLGRGPQAIRRNP